jgi:hypothetical protein
MLKYRAFRVQRGRGLGNVLGKLFRSALPLLKKGGILLAPHAARYGSRVLNDVADGTDVLESVKKHAKQTGTDIIGAVVNKQKGNGRKRAGKAATSKRPRRKKARAIHMRKLSRPKKKSQKIRRRANSAKSQNKPPLREKINDVFKYGY